MSPRPHTRLSRVSRGCSCTGCVIPPLPLSQFHSRLLRKPAPLTHSNRACTVPECRHPVSKTAGAALLSSASIFPKKNGGVLEKQGRKGVNTFFPFFLKKKYCKSVSLGNREEGMVERAPEDPRRFGALLASPRSAAVCSWLCAGSSMWLCCSSCGFLTVPAGGGWPGSWGFHPRFGTLAFLGSAQENTACRA